MIPTPRDQVDAFAVIMLPSAKINPNEVAPIQRRLTRELGRLTGVFGDASLNPPATFAEIFHHAVQLVFDFARPGSGVVNQQSIHCTGSFHVTLISLRDCNCSGCHCERCLRSNLRAGQRQMCVMVEIASSHALSAKRGRARRNALLAMTRARAEQLPCLTLLGSVASACQHLTTLLQWIANGGGARGATSAMSLRRLSILYHRAGLKCNPGCVTGVFQLRGED